MKVHRTIRYRLHAGTRAKTRKLAGTAGACRYVWNHFVGKLRDEYVYYGKENLALGTVDYRFYSMGKLFTVLRRHYAPWLQEYSMPMVRQALKPIETAYRQFYKKEGGLPRFHARYVHPDSFPLCAGAFRLKGRYLYIAKIGEVLLLGPNPYADGVPKSGTVKRECGKWYAYYLNPAYTSQTCNKCGNVDKENRKTQAAFLCTACGHRDNADVNAALNILAFGNRAAGRGGCKVTWPVKRQMDTLILTD